MFLHISVDNMMRPVHPQLLTERSLWIYGQLLGNREIKFSRCLMSQIFGLSVAAPAAASDGAIPGMTGFNQTLSSSHLSSLNFNYLDIDLEKQSHQIKIASFVFLVVFFISKTALNGAFAPFCLIYSSTFSQCQTWKINISQFDARLKPALYLLNVTCN